MCQSCNVVTINGVKCHETGCPDAYKEYMIECAECGAEFIPETRHQKCCSESCYFMYSGFGPGLTYDAGDIDEL